MGCDPTAPPTLEISGAFINFIPGIDTVQVSEALVFSTSAWINSNVVQPAEVSSSSTGIVGSTNSDCIYLFPHTGVISLCPKQPLQEDYHDLIGRSVACEEGA